MKKAKTFSITSILRGFKYIATLRSNGQLLNIRAGCRNWPSFVAAEKHYSDSSNNWSDQFVDGNPYAFAYRLEARTIIGKLKKMVDLFNQKKKSIKKPVKKAKTKRRR